ncbi:GIY-YIG nuclease family protein [Siminovitchia sp. 179-K 8D1 HS]|uniref:GIY-YIG nuclease family protein n=1 Tax=Siminovitchia sp. 179-K 8D1 HS TaxID=3142385 RepID=UPI0039A0B238
MGNNNKHYFYVLQCSDGSYYGGYTVDPERRLAEHNGGKGAKYTRARLPANMIHLEEFGDKGEALRAEYAFKRLSRHQKEQFLKAGELNAQSE